MLLFRSSWLGHEFKKKLRFFFFNLDCCLSSIYTIGIFQFSCIIHGSSKREGCTTIYRCKSAFLNGKSTSNSVGKFTCNPISVCTANSIKFPLCTSVIIYVLHYDCSFENPSYLHMESSGVRLNYKILFWFFVSWKNISNSQKNQFILSIMVFYGQKS